MHDDYDYLIIGSGFGGSVAAMRLTEKGYRVGVLEAGRRWKKEDFPKTNWNLRRFVFMPFLGLRGIMRFSLFPHVMVLSGAGVGGGSLVYANTLYEPPQRFYKQGAWSKLLDWEKALTPHYATAKRMMGVTQSPFKGPGDKALEDCARDLGREHTFQPTPVAVHFGQPGETTPDPYFDGEGPDRVGCTLCGGCMVGCRVGAKNTLDRNYLYFAEKGGAQILPERMVVDIKEVEEGKYRVTTERSGAWFFKDRQTLTCRGVILSAGVLGTMKLLHRSKLNGSLPKLSPRLGDKVCTNSESILGVTAHNDDVDYSQGLAITASVYVDDDTHMEVVRYPKGSGLISTLGVYLTDGGTRFQRWAKFLGNTLRHPIASLRIRWPFKWAQRTSILLAMQTIENYIRLEPKRLGSWLRLTTRVEKGKGIPTYIPLANQVARDFANRVGGTPQSSVNEVLWNAPATAHILGGAPMGETAEEGVIDAYNRVHGYKNLYVCDGSMVPGNLGVNPSLTILAMTEHAMSHIPFKDEANSQIEIRQEVSARV